MWWIFGLVNVIIVMLFTWFYFNEIKEGEEWTMKDKVAVGLLVILAFLGGVIATVGIVGLIVYLIIDFILFVKNKRE
jgi:hypothetical protein